jgi:dipeptidyl aminopeptidase/acylaminoacyl peptidase
MRLRLTLALAVALALMAAPAVATTPAGLDGEIVFEHDPPSTPTVIAVMQADGTGRTPMAVTPGMNQFTPVFSPDGRFIYFEGNQFPSAIGDLYRVNRDGTGMVNLTNTPDTSMQEREPAVSPDGRRIAFGRTAVGHADLFSINPDGAELLNLSGTPAPVAEEEPDYSPDGRSIVFVRSTNTTPGDIWIMNADGSSPRALTNTPANEGFPTFTRDGRRVVFTTDSGPSNDLGVVNVDGTGLAPLTQTTGQFNETRAVPSGDGRRFAFEFTDTVAGNFDIGLIPSAGGSPVDFTGTDPIDEGSPDWLAVQRCGKKRVATIVGDDGPDTIAGTKGADVIDANGGRNRVRSGGGNDLICAGKKARINCGGGGKDRIVGKYRKAKNCERGKGL